MRRILFAVWWSLLFALLASPALAQTGQINGVVTDNSGAVVPGATVKAVEVATALSRETVTGSDGRCSGRTRSPWRRGWISGWPATPRSATCRVPLIRSPRW